QPSQLLTYIRLLDAALRIRRREPRWIFACFHLNGAQTLACAMPVHTPGSGSDGVTVSPSPVIWLQLPGKTPSRPSSIARIKPPERIARVRKRYSRRAWPRRYEHSCWRAPRPRRSDADAAEG